MIVERGRQITERRLVHRRRDKELVISNSSSSVWPKHTFGDTASEFDDVCARRRDHSDHIMIKSVWNMLGRRLLCCVRDEEVSLSQSTKSHLANVWRTT